MGTKEWLEKDFYKVLGVSKDAKPEEIKKSYRKLARANHPDANRGDAKAEERFKEVSEAYSVLSDPAKRKEYDEARSLFGGGGFRFPGGGGGAGGQAGGGFPFDLGDIFTQQQGGNRGGGGLGDILGGIFTGGRTRTPPGTRPRRGADVETEVTIGFRDAVDGVTVPLRMTSDAPCPACSGTGAKAGTMPRVCPDCEGVGMRATSQGGRLAMTEPCRSCRGRGLVVDNPCPTCHGSGRAESARTMQVRIPAGVYDNQRIRLRAKGAAGERGGPAGDLYVTVHVQADERFGRKGEHLTVTVPISFPEAALGGEVKVPTLAGPLVTLKVPPGTPNGRTFRVRGKGAARRDGTKGDLLVTVEVVVPDHLDDKAREALDAYRRATGSDAARGEYDGKEGVR
ncbi:molecular chaperone DnaJ [Actinopolymorpha cephalotaxi]|uniref:Chaperone protein DnaJ n=1 Tax=Actinopolymorpha cephalotaxi TaxID=504797 RepID=A0A1I3CH33_9ACTN|nr:molecular chaperone DnaJ [Actinopolymorpha cephalotaxi]NYH86286.1 molecular chaperone DnaJ [Actinopolymorpha cephalotaxi]SFH73765.1 molecular chaperone DnaJ [Actinopolymorpha cephalotaxi]